MKTGFRKIFLFFASILICQLAGAIGSIFTLKNIPAWYAGLDKPFFSPPNWLFGPVWITLYTMMGASLYFVFIKEKEEFTKPVKIFLLHLIINSLWSIVFFGMRNPGLGFFVITVLWSMILYLIRLFRKTDKRASYLLYPYFVWVTFASFLNLAVWYLN